MLLVTHLCLVMARLYRLGGLALMAKPSPNGSSCKITYNIRNNRYPCISHWIFQYVLLITCSNIVSGAMIGRTSFPCEYHLFNGTQASSIHNWSRAWGRWLVSNNGCCGVYPYIR